MSEFNLIDALGITQKVLDGYMKISKIVKETEKEVLENKIDEMKQKEKKLDFKRLILGSNKRSYSAWNAIKYLVKKKPGSFLLERVGRDEYEIN